jgi:PP-loop superfamily ATP-utilizing enzyme
MVELKLAQLRSLFMEMEQALVAYSGGIDSTLVAKIAYDVLGDKAMAVTIHLILLIVVTFVRVNCTIRSNH